MVERFAIFAISTAESSDPWPGLGNTRRYCGWFLASRVLRGTMRQLHFMELYAASIMCSSQQLLVMAHACTPLQSEGSLCILPSSARQYESSTAPRCGNRGGQKFHNVHALSPFTMSLELEHVAWNPASMVNGFGLTGGGVAHCVCFISAKVHSSIEMMPWSWRSSISCQCRSSWRR